ncbi:MAG: hypothetical protein SRB2_00134 [Desulfobacteraceae bacterium Eth-SRB2]|nr:MAG: hypothetical protein SRB2_00134 [Desulfobacteraceae bacterium Eth-SRB2]
MFKANRGYIGIKRATDPGGQESLFNPGGQRTRSGGLSGIPVLEPCVCGERQPVRGPSLYCPYQDVTLTVTKGIINLKCEPIAKHTGVSVPASKVHVWAERTTNKRSGGVQSSRQSCKVAGQLSQDGNSTS